MKIALIQQHAGHSHDDNMRRGIEAFRQAARSGAHLIAYPELAFSRFLPQVPAASEFLRRAESIPGPTTEVFSVLAREHGVVVILNLFERDGDKTYDSSPVIDADGRLLGTTRMVHIMEGPGFHERGFYTPAPEPPRIYATEAGKIGVAICYDRHYPEYMRSLAINGAELVVVPQAGTASEWTEGIFEAELQVASFQNGYYSALVNRVGKEEILHFAGESYVVDPNGRVVARAPKDQDFILTADCDFSLNLRSHARKHFLIDRRPAFYREFNLLD
jgi:beta-ureidopropionase